jgi:DNA-binding response OmpR family regulator
MPKVLIVDDRLDALALAEMALSLAGIEVLTTTDVAQAVAMVAGHQPELVLVDAHMPGLNASETVQRLREAPAPKPIRIMLYTAMDREFAGSMAGCDGILPKTGNMDEFVRQVKDHMHQLP